MISPTSASVTSGEKVKPACETLDQFDCGLKLLTNATEIVWVNIWLVAEGVAVADVSLVDTVVDAAPNPSLDVIVSLA